MLPAVEQMMRSAHLIAVSSYGCQRSTSEEGEVRAGGEEEEEGTITREERETGR